MSADKYIEPRIPNWKKIIYFFFHTLFIFLLGTGFIFAHDMITKTSEFPVNQINIKGNTVLTDNEICKIAGFREFENIFKINISVSRLKLEKNPWIKTAKVKRTLPATIEIEIIEEKPCAKINFKDNFILNFQGELFKKLEKKDEDLNIPEITGISYRDLTQKNYFFYLVMDIVKQKNIIFANNSIIHLDKDIGISLFNTDSFNEIVLGFNDFEQKIRNLNLIRHYVTQKFDGMKIEKIDLSNKNRVILKPFPAMG
ncbi:MAG: FtsQ-type POTRA domain-containing protein [Desulfobacteraceae bacterium]|nr:FtsQ-type POTRA domain-containing protein [Desulfobacteraceae bacterium]MCB9494504.1 FtsQ-type POTRA domain-containing protein [Desulfobacteraceae bacterium]